jgi:hypothetical protein
MKTILAIAIFSMSVPSFADWTAKIKCKTVGGNELVAKAQVTLKVVYDTNQVPIAELILDSVSLFSSYGASSGSTFKNILLQSVEMTTEGDYAFGLLLPIVDHKVINRIELGLGEPGANTIIETNKGNRYVMACSYL